jgi:F-type H+-transporting ATPase subunit a
MCQNEQIEIHKKKSGFLKHGFFFLLAFAFILISATNAFSQETHDSHHEHESDMNPGDVIFDHIYDSYEWHILTYEDIHISIPLIAILYSEDKGFQVFPTSKFHHGHSEYKGFRIAGKNEDYPGQIVEKTDTGEWKPPFIDISITKTVLGIFFSCALLIIIFTKIAKKYKQRGNSPPTGLQNALEPLIIFIRDDVAKDAIGDKKYEQFLPYLLTIFFFIFVNNLLGLIPFPPPAGANVTGNITVTGVLALFTFFITTIKGNKNYWKHIFNTPGVPWWMKFPIPLVPVVEILGMITKPFVLMVRLFANITAGHIVSLGFFALIFVFGNMNVVAGYGISVVSISFAIFITFLELLVAFIQAYVFTLLSALYFGMATEEHH